MFDIITIGDTTTDIFLSIDEQTSLCKLDKKKMELKLKYASKVPVKELHRVIGAGNASNYAFGAAKLGLKTAIYTILGADDAGDATLNKMQKSKISTDYVEVDKKNGTNMSVIMNYGGDRTILSYHADREYCLPKFAPTKWIYFSSISNDHEMCNKQLNEYVKKNNVKLGFNPGSRQINLDIKILKPILEVAEVLFVNKQEGEKLSKKKGNIKSIMKCLYELGPKIIVMTDGANGSYSYDGNNFYKLGVMKLPAVESTGSGDAYASGFVVAMINKHTVSEAMCWGGANASSVMGKVGSQAGLLNKHQIQELLQEHAYFKPVLF